MKSKNPDTISIRSQRCLCMITSKWFKRTIKFCCTSWMYE